jgi:hypothetical protein
MRLQLPCTNRICDNHVTTWSGGGVRAEYPHMVRKAGPVESLGFSVRARTSDGKTLCFAWFPKARVLARVRVRVRARACTCSSSRACGGVCVCVCGCACVRALVRVRMRVRFRARSRARVCMCLRVRVCVHVRASRLDDPPKLRRALFGHARVLYIYIYIYTYVYGRAEARTATYIMRCAA